jgi:hypothetical protein
MVVLLQFVSMTNLVNSSGVVATDVTGVGTARRYISSVLVMVAIKPSSVMVVHGSNVFQ